MHQSLCLHSESCILETEKDSFLSNSRI